MYHNAIDVASMAKVASAVIDGRALGLAVRMWRRHRGLSLRKAEAESGVPREIINRAEAGAVPSLEYYARLCRWLSLSLDEFVRKDA